MINLAAHGFKRLASLTWGEGLSYRLVDRDAEAWRTPHIIYTYMDVLNERCLYVGHAGQKVGARVNNESYWLNGKRKSDNDTPVLHRWRKCLMTCAPGSVEVWIKPSHVDGIQREIEEGHWIEQLKSVLNTRRRRGSTLAIM